jgi:hypothetical protein
MAILPEGLLLEAYFTHVRSTKPENPPPKHLLMVMEVLISRTEMVFYQGLSLIVASKVIFVTRINFKVSPEKFLNDKYLSHRKSYERDRQLNTSEMSLITMMKMVLFDKVKSFTPGG